MAYQGINQRASAGYVTDGSGETYSLGEVYPVVRGGQTFGWSVDNSGNARDRANTVDRRLAGTNYSTGVAVDFRMDLAGTGVGTIRLALGDISNGGAQYVQLLDGGIVFATITGTSTGTDQFLDATGVPCRSDPGATNWASANVAVTHTFTSTNFTVRLGNGTIGGRLAHVSVDIAAAAPVSFSGPVPTRNGVVGSAASFANAGFFAGSQTPFTYSNVGAALPAGLTLRSSTGIISGTPTTAGTTSGIIIRATDAGSDVANTNSYSIVIAASNAAPTFPGNISNISGTAGTAITPVNISGQFSDTDALTYTASPAGTAWPSGLVVNSSTGIISGTVAGAGTTTGLKVRATDTASQMVDSNAFNAVIGAASATRTWTPTIKLEALADETPFANWAIHAVINDMAGNKIDTKTGLVTSSAGLPPPFTTTTGSLATDYRVTYIDDTDLTIFAVENLRCV